MFLVPQTGLEPVTHEFSIRCSTIGAIVAWADSRVSISIYDFHRVGCSHYTNCCINYCTLSRNHCQYCSVVICFLCLAGDTGIEPVSLFLNEGLASLCCTLQHISRTIFEHTSTHFWNLYFVPGTCCLRRIKQVVERQLANVFKYGRCCEIRTHDSRLKRAIL